MRITVPEEIMRLTVPTCTPSRDKPSRHILDTSYRHLSHILHISCTHLAHFLRTPCKHLAHFLQTSCTHIEDIMHNSYIFLTHILRTSCTHLAHIFRTSCTHIEHNLHTFTLTFTLTLWHWLWHLHYIYKLTERQVVLLNAIFVLVRVLLTGDSLLFTFFCYHHYIQLNAHTGHCLVKKLVSHWRHIACLRNLNFKSIVRLVCLTIYKKKKINQIFCLGRCNVRIVELVSLAFYSRLTHTNRSTAATKDETSFKICRPARSMWYQFVFWCKCGMCLKLSWEHSWIGKIFFF